MEPGSVASDTGPRIRLLNVNEALSRAALTAAASDESEASFVAPLTGPRCPYARTLEGSYRWRADPRQPAAAPSRYLVEVHESCLWEPEHPFLYHTPPFHLGFRSLIVRDGQLLLNGRPYWVRGLVRQAINEQTLSELHSWGCNFLDQDENLPAIGATDNAAFDLTDRFGPFVFGRLPADSDSAAELVANSAGFHPSIAVWLSEIKRSGADYRQLREQDRWTILAERRNVESDLETNAELLILSGDLDAILAAQPNHVAWLARPTVAAAANVIDKQSWEHLVERMDTAIVGHKLCVGWMAG